MSAFSPATADLMTEVFQKVQSNVTCHQRCLILLKEHFQTVDFMGFVKCFFKFISKAIIHPSTQEDPNVARYLQFAASFIAALKPVDDEDDFPLLQEIIQQVLLHHKNDSMLVRYRVCKFVNLVLHALGEESYLSSFVCDIIQVVMLRRIKDVKPMIRHEAVKALQRLQNPADPNCPIITAYVLCLADSSPLVRQAAIQNVALTSDNMDEFLKHCRDVAESVRLTAYKKFAVYPVLGLKIVQRRDVIESAYADPSQSVRKYVEKELLPKWLTRLDGNYFSLMHRLLLDANENDIKLTNELWTNVLHSFFRSTPIKEMIEFLPLDEEKLLPLDCCTPESLLLEKVAYWNILFKFFHSDESMNDLIELIVPELLHFCKYIEKAFLKMKTSKNEYEILTMESVLQYLLEMVNYFDFSDEMSRNVLLQQIEILFTSTLMNKNCLTQLSKSILKLFPDEDICMQKICTFISDIRKPLIAPASKPTYIKKKATNEMKIASIRVRLVELDINLEQAVNEKEYAKASELKEKFQELQLEKAKLEAEDEEYVTKEEQEPQQADSEGIKNDLHTMVCCLNIINAFWMEVHSVGPTMRNYLEDFVIPLLIWPDPLILSEVYKAVGLCSIYSKDVAEKYKELFVKRFIQCKMYPNEMSVNLILIKAMCDLLCLYGHTILDNNLNNTISIDSTNIENSTSIVSNKGRKLLVYDGQSTITTDTVQELEASPEANFLNVIKMFIDMMKHSTYEEVREQAGFSLVNLMLSGNCKSSTVLSEIIIGWANPATDPKLRATLGTALEVMIGGNSKVQVSVIEDCIVPVLTTIGNAPKTSPLADIDIESLNKFINVFLIGTSKKLRNANENVAINLCSKLLLYPNSKCVPIYIKCLTTLDIFDPVVMKNLFDQGNLIVKHVSDKVMNRRLTKYLLQLENKLANEERRISTTEVNNSVLQQTVAAVEEPNDTNAEHTSSASFKTMDTVSQNMDTSADSVRENTHDNQENGTNNAETSDKEINREAEEESAPETQQAEKRNKKAKNKDNRNVKSNTRTEKEAAQNENGIEKNEENQTRTTRSTKKAIENIENEIADVTADELIRTRKRNLRNALNKEEINTSTVSNKVNGSKSASNINASPKSPRKSKTMSNTSLRSQDLPQDQNVTPLRKSKRPKK